MKIQLSENNFVYKIGDKFPIDQLSKIIVFSSQLEKGIKERLQSKRFKKLRVGLFIAKNLEESFEILLHAKDVKNELMNLSESEKIDLRNIISKEYGIDPKDIQKAIDEILVPLWAILELIDSYLSSRNKDIV